MRSATRFPRLTLLVVALIAWGGLGYLAVPMLAHDPPNAGFDLDLIVVAGGRVADGLTPYSERMIDGTATVSARNLFYTYPPPVAQAISPLAGLPLPAVLAALWVAAAAGWLLVVDRLARELLGHQNGLAVVAAVAVAPLVFPFAIGLLFGNVSTLYPLVYGLGLVGVIAAERRGSRAWPIAGGIALGLATVGKIHPGGLLIWLAVRGWRERSGTATGSSRSSGSPESRAGLPGAWLLAAVALATMAAAGGLSLALFGASSWVDWLAVMRTASGVPLALDANVGPASILALLLSAGEPLVRPLHLVVVIVAVGVTVLAAWRVRDTVTSLAVAAAASLVLLPLTWLHYPSVLMPFVAASLLASPADARRPTTAILLGLAVLCGILSVGLPVLIWVGIAAALVIVVRRPVALPAEPAARDAALPATGPGV